jgi:phosphate starvation-inducible PhoH-like protein
VKLAFPNTTVKPLTDNQELYLETLFSKDLVLGLGPAGTGKTHLAVAVAIKKLITNKVQRVVMSRPVVEAGENLGYLPGTPDDKLKPYIRPLIDTIDELVGEKQRNDWQSERKIVIEPLAFLRGRTLKNSAVILDEAQNATSAQLKLYMTRLGKGSWMCVNGDPHQTDLDNNRAGALRNAADKLSQSDLIGVVEMEAVDIVRHPIVEEIQKYYV